MPHLPSFLAMPEHSSLDTSTCLTMHSPLLLRPPRSSLPFRSPCTPTLSPAMLLCKLSAQKPSLSQSAVSPSVRARPFPSDVNSCSVVPASVFDIVLQLRCEEVCKCVNKDCVSRTTSFPCPPVGDLEDRPRHAFDAARLSQYFGAPRSSGFRNHSGKEQTLRLRSFAEGRGAKTSGEDRVCEQGLSAAKERPAAPGAQQTGITTSALLPLSLLPWTFD